MGWCSRTYGRVILWSASLLLLAAVVTCWDKGAKAQQNPPQPAAGQDEQPPAAEDNTAQKKPESLGNVMFVNSGFIGLSFYIFLFMFSIAALMVAIERLVNLRRSKVMPAPFVSRLRDLLQRGDDSAESFRSLSESSSSPIALILKAGMMRAGRPLPEVEKSMEDAAAREMASMRSRNRPLSIVGSIAPLVGLLGTVVGLIFAFQIAGQEGLGKVGRAGEFANGIYLALITTAAGLTIAIPALLLAAWFNGKAERYMREIDECLLETMPSFARMENQISTAKVSREELVEAVSSA